MNQDRRGAPRVVFRAEVLAYAGSQKLICRASDLSETGMLIRASEPVRAPFMRLLLRRGEQEAWIDLDAVVVRQVQQGHLFVFGVQFTDLPPGAQRAVRALVAARRSRSQPMDRSARRGGTQRAAHGAQGKPCSTAVSVPAATPGESPETEQHDLNRLYRDAVREVDRVTLGQQPKLFVVTKRPPL